MECVITARRKGELDALAGELGDACTAIVGDVTDEGFNQQLIEESGDLYAVYANAGHGIDQAVAGCDMQDST